MGRQHGADAEAIGIAGGEHGDRLAAMGEDLRNGFGDGARPGLKLAARQAVGESQVPLAADDKLGVPDEGTRSRRQPLGAVFADTDDGKPSRLLTVRAHNATSSAA